MPGWTTGLAHRVDPRSTYPTRLGANIGDYLGSPHADGGLGLGTLGTSVLFLGTILAVVVYLTKTQKDRIELVQAEPEAARD